MESSFLTFSPKVLARKKLSASASSRSSKLKLHKFKNNPLQDLCMSSSNVPNVGKTRRVVFGKEKDDSVVICESYNDGSPQDIPALLKDQKRNGERSPLSSSSMKKPIDVSSLQNDKFHEIEGWLEDLHKAHEKRGRIPVWSSQRQLDSTLKSNFNDNSNTSKTVEKTSRWKIPESGSEGSSKCVSPNEDLQAKSFSICTISGSSSEGSAKRISPVEDIRAKPFSICRISETSSDESVKYSGQNKETKKKFSDWRTIANSSDESDASVRKKNVRVLFIGSDSDGETSDKVASSAALRTVVSSSSSDVSSKAISKQCLPSGKRNSNSSCSRTSVSDESIISASSTNRIISTVYGKTLNDNHVATPKVLKRNEAKETILESASTAEEVLFQFYGNSWNKEKVLTPLLNKTRTKKAKEKENTPPSARTGVKIHTSKSEVPGNQPKTPAVRGDVKTTKFHETLSFIRSLSASPPTSQCNRRALIYKNEFKQNKEALCDELFKIFNREIFENKLPSSLKIDWNVRMNRTAGFCYNSWTMHREGKFRSSRIELSTKVCSSADRVRDTLIHELCHAATWIVNGVRNGHGAQWKAWTKLAMKKFPELPLIGRCHTYKIHTKYMYKCKRCGYSIGRHSKSLDVHRKRCGYCYGEFELLVNTKPKKSDLDVTSVPRTPRAASGFALYVKENYKATKEKNSGLKHAEIMKILGTQFAVVKIGSAQ